MRALLHRWLSRRLTVRIGSFGDHRTQELQDAAIYLDYARRVALNVAARGRAQMIRLGADPSYIPEHLRAQVPALLKRQAA